MLVHVAVLSGCAGYYGYCSDLLLLQRGRQGLLQLLGLGLVGHQEGVEVPAAPDLELRLGPVLLDLHGPGVLAAPRFGVG